MIVNVYLKLILEHSDKINLIFDLSFLNKGTNTIFSDGQTANRILKETIKIILYLIWDY